jgi:predicted ABC-type ATPase
LVDHWFVLDNSSIEAQLIAEGHENVVIKIINEERWSRINTKQP